jgi:hypothetical protein
MGAAGDEVRGGGLERCLDVSAGDQGEVLEGLLCDKGYEREANIKFDAAVRA